MSLITLNSQELRAERERRELKETFQEQAARYEASFYEFIKAAWPDVIPTPYVETPHVRTLAEHYQAALDREITRLLVTIPPGFLKSSIFTVFGPAWQWARNPAERFITGSHSDDLATRDTRRSRMLMQRDWFRQRWPIEFSGDENLKTRYSNTAGGHRIRMHVLGGTGERGTVLQLDDPHNAREVHTETQLEAAKEWWADTWASRLDDSVDARGVMVVVGQRIHENDLIGHILNNDVERDRWVHLCLPVEYSAKHKYVYPRTRELPSGKVIQGDIRTAEGELLAPAFMDAERLADKTSDMSASVYAAQYLQVPAPREGNLLKRAHWQYYPRNYYDGDKYPSRFRLIVTSWDTAFKDKTSSDYVAGQVWGTLGADKWLLRLVKKRMSLGATKREIKMFDDWIRKTFPGVPVYHLIEKSANGVEIIGELKREITGITPVVVSVDKVLRAEAAEPSLESGNVWVPGRANQALDGYDDGITPAEVQDLIESCAVFPRGAHDDDVDAFTQAVNWLNSRGKRSVRMTIAEGVL